MLIQMSRWGPSSLASGVDLDGVKRLLEAGAQLLDLPKQSLAVLTLTGDEHLREYNRRYRGLDEPTDVLAFAAQEAPSDQRFQAPPGTEHWLGDIVISLPRAREQARAAHHSMNDEVRLLAVHGFLHLLGYDHAEPDEEARMKKLTTRLLELSP
ncbi:MAG TPA: rRNA maturation RNase YbeY [Candidatus Dormibacteraeota bacterium]|nr:rRNA maturation RNase YbeY [Candidatus Dormibacteraeota bacterium]